MEQMDETYKDSSDSIIDTDCFIEDEEIDLSSLQELFDISREFIELDLI